MKKFIILESEKKEILNRYGLINEKVSRDLPSDIKNALSSVERKYGVTIDDSHVDKEMDQEGQYYDDNGSENSKLYLFAKSY